MLDGLAVVTHDRKTVTGYEHRIESVPHFASKLCTWGDTEVVKGQTKRMSEIGVSGFTCMLAGYNKNSGDNVYRMWNPGTKRIHNTRDIIWLKSMFYQEKLITVIVTYMMQFDDSYIDKIQVVRKEVSDCDVIENPNFHDEKGAHRCNAQSDGICVYMMWNPDTSRIHNTRDIIWLKGMFYQEKLITVMVTDTMKFDDSYIDEI